MADLILLREICSLITKGSTPTVEDGGFSDAGINFIKSESLTYSGAIDRSKFSFISEATHQRLRRSHLMPRDILYSIAGANLGKCGIAKADMLPANTNQAVAIIRVDQMRASPEFVSYVLRNISFVQMVLGGVAQSAQPNVNLGDIGRFKIPNWPLRYQQAVASVLGSLDHKIELNKSISETLEALARGMFTDWFVEFGPTRAKMEGRAPYLAPHIWSLFPDRLDETGKPEGWMMSTIGEEVDVVGGSTPSTKEPAFWGGDIAWATPKDLSSLGTPVLLGTERRITDAGLSQVGSGLLPSGTVLLSSRAPIGYMAITAMPTAVNQGFIAMVCRKRLSNVFVWLWTQTNMEAVHQRANGSTFQEISKANFRPISVTVAQPDILRLFDEAVGPLFDQIVSAARETRSLTAMRDCLLPALLSGEARIREEESFV